MSNRAEILRAKIRVKLQQQSQQENGSASVQQSNTSTNSDSGVASGVSVAPPATNPVAAATLPQPEPTRIQRILARNRAEAAVGSGDAAHASTSAITPPSVDSGQNSAVGPAPAPVSAISSRKSVPPNGSSSCSGLSVSTSQPNAHASRRLAPNAATPSPPSSGSPVPDLSDGMSSIAIIDPSEKRGSAGQKLALMVNYLKIEVQQNSFFEYSVTFNPNIDNINLRKRILRQQSALEFTSYEGASTLYSIKPIPTPHAFTFMLSQEQKEVTVKIEMVRQIGVNHPQRCQLLNCMFTRLLRIMKYKIEKKGAFLTHQSKQVPQHNMEVWPGYVMTVSHGDGGLVLQCDVTHRVIRTQNVYDLMREIRSRAGPNFKAIAGKEICNEVVMTRYNKRTYRVDDIDWDKTPRSLLTLKDGSEVTFAEFYLKVWETKIVDLDQPLLLHRKKNRRDPQMPEQEIYIVPELCYMTGLTDKIKNDRKLMKDISSHVRPDPMPRVDAVRRFVRSVRSEPRASQELQNWGVTIPDEPMILEGRNIMSDNQRVVFGNNVQLPISRTADFSREVTNNRVVGPVDLSNWVVIHRQQDAQLCSKFVCMLMEGLRSIGMQVNVAQPLTLTGSDRAQDYVEHLKAKLTPDVQCVVCVFNNNREDRYNAVKQLLCRQRPVPSQCVISGTLNKDKQIRRIALNIGLQMVAKMGGQLWQVNIPHKLRRAMFVGMDVYHQAKGKSNSVVGFVASRNPGASKYYSQSFAQGRQEEIITNNLRGAMVRAIKKYQQENGFLPDSVVIFRDGVGDGQIEIVQSTEIALMKQAFADISLQYSPHLCCVVVQKRISARIFADERGNVVNAPPGTIIDHTITRRGFRDFYLVSQHVREGTVTPTRYVVVENTPGGVSEKVAIDVDTIQNLAFKMTFMYYNWPGSVRVPAPCQYAHKIAQLVGMNIGAPAHVKLEDKLWYL